MEETYGYTRAVAVGPHVFVSGTAPIPADGSDPPEGAYDQARLCLEIIVGALDRAGSRADDVVRSRVYVVPGIDFAEVGRAHAEVFAEARPAMTGVVVAALLDPRWLVEIEVEAVVDG